MGTKLFRPWQDAIMLIGRGGGHPWHVLKHFEVEVRTPFAQQGRAYALCGRTVSAGITRYVHSLKRSKICKDCKAAWVAEQLLKEDQESTKYIGRPG